MSKIRHVPDQMEMAEAWDVLRAAIERVETAGPFRMTADITSLREERRRFEDILMGRAALPHKGGGE